MSNFSLQFCPTLILLYIWQKLNFYPNVQASLPMVGLGDPGKILFFSTCWKSWKMEWEEEFGIEGEFGIRRQGKGRSETVKKKEKLEMWLAKKKYEWNGVLSPSS